MTERQFKRDGKPRHASKKTGQSYGKPKRGEPRESTPRKHKFKSSGEVPGKAKNRFEEDRYRKGSEGGKESASWKKGKFASKSAPFGGGNKKPERGQRWDANKTNTAEFADSKGRKPRFKSSGDFVNKGKRKFSTGDSNDRPAGKRSSPWKKERSAGGGMSKRRSEDNSFPERSFDRHRDVRRVSSGESSFVQSRVEKQRRKQKPVQRKVSSGDGLVRLNKYIANSGVGSRRYADELIVKGLISVNGKAVTELGSKVNRTDDVRFEGKRLKAESLVYILLNKPKGFITTTDDPQERNTVMNLVAAACKERIYPVGRLDRNTTGLLLLTNDGELAGRLMHPSFEAKKIYKVELNKPITKNDLNRIMAGVPLEEGKVPVDDVAVVSDDKRTVGIELHVGWNRIVRRLFEELGYEVLKLDRVVYAGLDKKNLGRGQWRLLKNEEIVRLKHFK